jgi:hypothetical protein
MKELLAHLVGDYILQNHWEATEKINSNLPAFTHAAKYTAAFLPVTRDPKALAIIGGTHFVLDRWRLAKRIAWAKNQIGVPQSHRNTYAEVKDNAGYPPDVPAWLSTWLMIIADNTIHMTINHLALEWSKK